MAQLGVLILKYLSLVSVTVHDVLEVRLRSLQLVNLPSRFVDNSKQ
jgi:hypothetical protein